jgi:cephalosporin hydroxylase
MDAKVSDDPVDNCFAWAGPRIAPPLQYRDELVAFLDFLAERDVRSYLEVGVRYGGTFEAVMTRRPVGSRGVAVDFPGGDFGDDKSPEILFGTMRRLRAIGQDVRAIFGPSAAPEVIARAAALGPYDCVFIDADHAYDAAKLDLKLYAPMARKMIVLHDIAAPDGHRSTRGTLIETGRLWREVKAAGDCTHEIIAPGSDMGIGIIFGGG